MKIKFVCVSEWEKMSVRVRQNELWRRAVAGSSHDSAFFGTTVK